MSHTMYYSRSSQIIVLKYQFTIFGPILAQKTQFNIVRWFNIYIYIFSKIAMLCTCCLMWFLANIKSRYLAIFILKIQLNIHWCDKIFKFLFSNQLCQIIVLHYQITISSQFWLIKCNLILFFHLIKISYFFFQNSYGKYVLHLLLDPILSQYQMKISC